MYVYSQKNYARLRRTAIAFLLASVFAVNGAPAPSLQKAWRKASARKTPAPAKTERAVPVIDGESIVCGNKRVDFTVDGKIRISTDRKLLAEISCHQVFRSKKSGQIDWNTFTKDECRFRRTGNRFLWELGKATPEATWKLADQTLELTPDGLLHGRVSFHAPPGGDLEPRRKDGQLFIILPQNSAEGKEILYNGKKIVPDMKGDGYVSDWKSRIFQYCLYAEEPTERFMIASPNTNSNTTSMQPDFFSKGLRIVFLSRKSNTIEFTIDLRESAAHAEKTGNVRGGIDFKAVENLELPDCSGKNLFVNPSFERGLEGYRVKHANTDGQWDWEPFRIDSREAFRGNNSLMMDARAIKDSDFRRLKYGVNLTTAAVVVPAGTYTISLSAKCEKGKSAAVNIWVPNFHTGSLYAALGKEAVGRFRITPEWKRHSITFQVKKTTPLELHMNAESSMGTNVWIDALQLESGSKATEFEAPPAEGQLLTGSPGNFLSPEEKVAGKLRITTAEKNRSGKLNVRVRNFFGEELLNREFRFKTNEKGIADVALPLEELPGLGVFTVRTDFTLDDGKKSFDHHRYARVRFLENDYRNKNVLSPDCGMPEEIYSYRQNLERWRKLGIGMLGHRYTLKKKAYDTERGYGLKPSHIFLATWLQIREKERKRIVGFGLLDSDRTGSYVLPDDKRLILRDFYLDNNGELTEEYLQRFKAEVRKIAGRNPQIPLWGFACEFSAKCPPEWWMRNGAKEEPLRRQARILKAFAEGVREGNPQANVFQDAPSNMRPEGGIAETAHLLAECSRIGLRFDGIAIHTYRSAPESPDLDSDTQTLLKMLDEQGYPAVPVIWPEGMHWGPFDIPQWGTKSASWTGVPTTWPGALLSYDMGWTEKKSAAWVARAALVAYKYSDRVSNMATGCFYNNYAMDVMLTPYASQLIPNTLGNLLGDAVFKKDIRFAPHVRAYIFEDSRKRPVAAVWSHLDRVDDGYSDAPIAEADFGDDLEQVLDLMNSPRSFNKGRYRFPVSSFPLFLRGKPGSFERMSAALEKASIISGDGVSPLSVAANPQSETELRLTFQNFLSREFKGTILNRKITVPGAGSSSITVPLPSPLRPDTVSAEPLNVELAADSGARFRYDLSFEALTAKKVPAHATLDSLDWGSLPSVPFTRNTQGKQETSGSFRIGWNASGLFLEATIRDPKFSHDETRKSRWENDCLQVYIDTLANARARTFKGYDEDDYDYAVYPNSKGDSAVVYRFRSPDRQLGLATEAPPDRSYAPDIPCSFRHSKGILTYRLFLPARYLLPARLEKGWVLGLGLYVPNADIPGNVTSALTLAADGGGCWNRPHTWPAVLLCE